MWHLYCTTRSPDAMQTQCTELMAPLFQLGPRRLTLHQQPGVGRQRQRHQIRVSAALTAADLRQRALKLDTYDDDAVAQACTKLTAALGPDKAAKCGKETLEWFLRDRKLDVEKSAAKVTHALREHAQLVCFQLV